ncbi:MAG: amino acid ABC transporter substrate-binding protein [Rhodocyclales bacterium]|nr:amino acid ABC transporter substrate-binding protein [Rhodocyclales bacterium]
MIRIFCALLMLALLGAWGPMVNAQGVTLSTLEKIREYRAIYVGHRESAVPFSYMVGDEPMGYSIDICDRITDAIKLALNDPAMRVVKVPVTSSSRFLMLQAGTVDLECGSTTNTKIRQQLVSFGLTTFVSGIKAAVRKDSPIRQISDLDGKVVVTTSGTSTERTVRSVLTMRKVSGLFKAGRSHGHSLGMVVSSQADAFVIDDALLSGMIASSTQTDKLRIIDENFGYEPYSVVMRRDDPEFKRLVDKTLRDLMQSGELERIYAKWFMSPIPPRGINLNLPMSDLLRVLVRNPNDEGT